MHMTSSKKCNLEILYIHHAYFYIPRKNNPQNDPYKYNNPMNTKTHRHGYNVSFPVLFLGGIESALACVVMQPWVCNFAGSEL